jgi:hypothetical protein
MPKNAEIYRCEKCNFICSKKSNYDKHLTTAKHKSATNQQPKNAKKCRFICGACNKEYKDRTGLWRHSKKCNVQIPEENLYENPEIDVNIDVDTDIVVSSNSNSNILLELVKQNQELMTSNQEFKELMVEQQKENHELQKQLVDSVKHSSQTITNNTINNNQKFNLNFFLNEQCKDAMNMSDFLENMTLDMEDLTETGRLGYVNGISRILVNKLREIDTYKRPLHCTDLKRETLYIRENDEWSKEDNSKQTIKNLVDRVANKNCKTMRKWTEIHPNYTEMDTPDNQEFMKLSDAILGGFGEQESKLFRDRIIRSVIKDVTVNKM